MFNTTGLGLFWKYSFDVSGLQAARCYILSIINNLGCFVLVLSCDGAKDQNRLTEITGSSRANLIWWGLCLLALLVKNLLKKINLDSLLLELCLYGNFRYLLKLAEDGWAKWEISAGEWVFIYKADQRQARPRRKVFSWNTEALTGCRPQYLENQ